ncbi:MAG TPA: hypothetical protein VIT93_01880 [Dehalococcoidia bacterium]
MSTVEDRRAYSVDAETLRAAIIEAGKGVRLTKEATVANVVQINEPFNFLRFTWPAKLVASFSDEEGGVAIDFKVSNFGFGPIQGGHVKKVLAHVTSALAQYEQ